MIEFDVDMGYALESGELGQVVLHDENGEHDDVWFYRLDGLKAENAKLRELVRVMAYCMQHERECDECAMNGAEGTITAPVGCDGLLDRMRDLGVVE